MPTITIVSQIFGFISFAITLLTLLGVYRDLISTVRNAPHEIPILLGNLRQELEAERTALGRRHAQADEFGVFPQKIKTDRGWRKPRTAEITALLNQTITELWNNFKAIERPFLIRSGRRAEEVRGGDYWTKEDVAEKPGSRRKGRNRSGNDAAVEDATPTSDSGSYYLTGPVHRFIWWQSKSDIVALMDQVQRVQIRRIERDVFETDELVKRCLRILSAEGEGGESEDSEGGKGGGGGGGGGGGKSRAASRSRSRSRSRVGSVKVRERDRNRSHSRNRPSSGGYRERREVEVVRVRRDQGTSSRERERDRRTPAAEPASNTGRRRDSRPGAEFEYEVVRPGRVYVDVVDEGGGFRSRADRSRERDRERRRSTTAQRDHGGRYDG